MEKRISDRGYYPVRLTRDEINAWGDDPALVDERFRTEIVRGVERWMALADERLAGSGIRCIVSPANDDMFEIDPVIEAAQHVELGEARTIDLEGLSLVSTGWTNPTPWNTFREMPEPELRVRIDEIVAAVPDPQRAIFNIHVPPFGSNLDNAPKLDANMKYVSGGQALIPVGSRAVREAILAYKPPLSLHGHIHEGRGAVKLGPTLAVNPGSAYEDGALQAAIVDLDTRKGTVKRYLLIFNHSRDPVTLPEECDRPGEGLVGLRRVRVLVPVSQPRHPRDVLQPRGLRLRARRLCPVGTGPVRRGDDVPMHHLCRSDRGHAAGGRRLCLADPDPRWDSRRRRRRADRGRDALCPGERAGARRHRGAWRGGPRRDRRRVARHGPRRHWIRAVHDGVVVHPGALGADLRLHPEHRVRPAPRCSSRVARRSDVLRLAIGDVRRLRRDHRPRVRHGRSRDGRVRPDPALEHLHRDRRPGGDVHPDARFLPGHVQGRLRP